MIEYAQTLPPSANRAQCYNIANLSTMTKTIAEAIVNDHNSIFGALRAASLMVAAGAAKEINKRRPTAYENKLFGASLKRKEAYE